MPSVMWQKYPPQPWIVTESRLQGLDETFLPPNLDQKTEIMIWTWNLMIEWKVSRGKFKFLYARQIADKWVDPYASNKIDAWIVLVKRNNISNSFKVNNYHIFQDLKKSEGKEKKRKS